MTASPVQRDLRISKARNKNEWLWAYLLIAPTIIGLGALNVYPFFDSLYTSLLKSQGLGPTKFIGLQNYAKMFGSAEIWRTTLNTLWYVVLTVPVGVFLALVLAALLNTKIRGRDLYRGIYFLPMVVAPAAIAMVWRWIFNAENGILNQALLMLGIVGPKWLSDPNTALAACAAVGVWSSVGYDLVLILAGLQSISSTYYEASEIDGANWAQQFFRITVPLISPTLFFVILMRMMNSIKQFDTIFMLVKPENPAFKSTATLMVIFFREAFEKFNKGYASAVVVWSMVIIGAITAVQFVAEKKLVYYE
ncbi:MAG: sugar ABC transporter permease [Oscillospiraceae bacterium]|nr:sugar ABC transporter permease [Oscillospiraceae bacterium]